MNHCWETISDHDWVRGIKNKDSSTMECLWKFAYHYGVHASRRKGGDDDLGRDAAINALIRICNNIDQFKFGCRFNGYARRIVIREVFRLLPKSIDEKKKLFSIDKEDELMEIPAEPSNNEEERIESKIPVALKHLHSCIKNLSKRENLILSLKYFDSELLSNFDKLFSQSRKAKRQNTKKIRNTQIATQLDMTANHVGVLHSRALKKLKKCLVSKGLSLDVLLGEADQLNL